MDLKQLLNDKQYQAATYLGGHLRIIAGAGSGKTRVVTYRIAYLIEDIGVDPRNILAITFTNKAANEMKERVEHILGDYANGSTICTIHSLCVRVLRENITLLGYPRNFIIMDEEDQKSLIKKLYKELEIDQKELTVKSSLNYISSYKCNFISPSRAREMASTMIGEQKKAAVYKAYEDYNRAHNMVDFDDLLLKTLEIFSLYPEVVDKWQNRFQYVHVDEFQDVGEIEYKLIHYFANKSIVCVVGDPDQTIYSFRGSDVNYILNFDKDYQNVETVILDQNYRSTKNILDISNNLIRKNKNRLEKDLFTEDEEGHKVIHYSGSNEEAECQFITQTIEDIIATTEGVNYHDFAILYRANYLSRSIEQELIKKQIDYKIFGGLKFFNRKEVKDALSYIRLLTMSDDLSFDRIVNVPGRGIGAKTLEKIQLTALKYNLPEYETVCLYSDEIGLSSKVKKSLKEMIEAVERARTSSLPLEEVFENLLKEVGYFEMLKNDNDENRIDNLMELKNSIATYLKSHQDTPSFESYLQDIALYTSQDDTYNGEYVSLMSIHMAKGLEFNYVFVIGLTEDIFPSQRAVAESGDEGMEEERRLAYVAFTRAKKVLYLTDSQGFSFISKSPKLTSRFVEEIGKEHVEHVGSISKYKTKDFVHIGPTVDELIGDNEITDWHNGDLVEHDIFGKGVVIGIHGQTIDIAFSVPHGMKTLLASHKAIKRLTN